MDKTNTGEVTTTKEEVVEKQEAAVTTEPKVEETKPAGETQTPSKKEEVTPEVKEEKTPVTAQERINRMYARLQKEKSQHSETREKLNKITTDTPAENADTNVDDTDVDPTPAPKVDIDQKVNEVLARRDSEKRFKDSETGVLLRHETALNEDGSFNMEDAFTKAYIEVGRENQQLLYMENGPELAEALAEKKLGISYKRGRTDEAVQKHKAESAQTGASTTKTAPSVKVNLSDAEKKVAYRSGMTEQEYHNYKVKRDSGNTRV